MVNMRRQSHKKRYSRKRYSRKRHMIKGRSRRKDRSKRRKNKSRRRRGGGAAVHNCIRQWDGQVMHKNGVDGKFGGNCGYEGRPNGNCMVIVEGNVVGKAADAAKQAPNTDVRGTCMSKFEQARARGLVPPVPKVF